jgi:tripartite-type tricarboxylate transporter receptor subunit TctC
LRFALLSVCVCACTAVAAAAAYPEKPVRVIVPVPAGGTPDVVARMVLPGLSAALGQQLVVDNRGGAGGLIGAGVGAVGGALVGSPGTGALIGGALGAGTGALTNNSQINAGRPVWRQ